MDFAVVMLRHAKLFTTSQSGLDGAASGGCVVNTVGRLNKFWSQAHEIVHVRFNVNTVICFADSFGC